MRNLSGARCGEFQPMNYIFNVDRIKPCTARHGSNGIDDLRNHFVLAFCSIVYELLLGQALSAFLGNTVLRYSVTIGLYMMSLGIGSMIAEGRFVREPGDQPAARRSAAHGGGRRLRCIPVFRQRDGCAPRWCCRSSPTLLITRHRNPVGFRNSTVDQPQESTRPKNRDSAVIGVNYLGAFLGTIVFAFVFYPHRRPGANGFRGGLSERASWGVMLLTQSSACRSAAGDAAVSCHGLVSRRSMVLSCSATA